MRLIVNSRCFGLEKGVNEWWCHLRGGRGASSKGSLVSREPPEARHRVECNPSSVQFRALRSGLRARGTRA